MLIACILPAALGAADAVVFRDAFTSPESNTRWWPIETPAVRITSHDPPRFEFRPDGKLQAIGVIADRDDSDNWGVGFRWGYERPAAAAVDAIAPGFPSAEGSESNWPWPDRDVLELGRAALPALDAAIASHFGMSDRADRRAAEFVANAMLPGLDAGDFHGVNDYGRALLLVLLDRPELGDDPRLRAARQALWTGLEDALRQITANWPDDVTDPDTWPPATRVIIGDYGVAAVPALHALACAEPALAPKLGWMVREIRHRQAERLLNHALKHGGEDLPAWARVAAAASARELRAQLEQTRSRLVLRATTPEVEAQLAALDALEGLLQADPAMDELIRSALADGAEFPDVGMAAVNALLSARDHHAAHAAKRAWLAAVIRHRDRSPEHGFEPELGYNPEFAGNRFDEQRGYGFRAAAIELRRPGVLRRPVLTLTPGASYELTYRVRVRNHEFPADHPEAHRLTRQVAWLEIVPLDHRHQPVVRPPEPSYEPGVEPGRSAPYRFAADGPRNAGERHAFTPDGWVEGRILLPLVPDGVAGALVRIVLSNTRGAGEVIFDEITLTRVSSALDDSFEDGLRLWTRIDAPELGMSPFAEIGLAHGRSSEGTRSLQLKPGSQTCAVQALRAIPLRADRGYRLQAVADTADAELWIELHADGRRVARVDFPPGEGWRAVDVRLDRLLPVPRPDRVQVRVVARGTRHESAAWLDSIRLTEEPLVQVLPGDILPEGSMPSIKASGLPAHAETVHVRVTDGSSRVRHDETVAGGPDVTALLGRPGPGAYTAEIIATDADDTVIFKRTLHFVVLAADGASGMILETDRIASRFGAVRPHWAVLPADAELPRTGRFYRILEPTGDLPAALALLAPGRNAMLTELERVARESHDRVVSYHLGPLIGAGFTERGADPVRALDAARAVLDGAGAGWAEVVLPIELDSDLDRLARAFAPRWAEAVAGVPGLTADERAQLMQTRGAILLKPTESLNLVVPPHMDGPAMQAAIAGVLARIGAFEAPFRDAAHAREILQGAPWAAEDGAGRLMVTINPEADSNHIATFADRRVRLIALGTNRVLAGRTRGLLLDESDMPLPALSAWAHLGAVLDGATLLPLEPFTQAEVPHLLLRDRTGEWLLVVLAGGESTEYVVPAGHAARVYDVYGTRGSEAADTHGNLRVSIHDGMPVFVRGLDEGWLRTLATLRFGPGVDARLDEQLQSIEVTSHFRQPVEAELRLDQLAFAPARFRIRGATFGPGAPLPKLGDRTVAPGDDAAFGFALRPMPGFPSVPVAWPVELRVEAGGREYRAVRRVELPVSGEWQVAGARIERVEGQLELVLTLRNTGTEAARCSVDISLDGVQGSWRRGMAYAPAGTDTEVRFAWGGTQGADAGVLRVLVSESPGLRFATGMFRIVAGEGDELTLVPEATLR